MIETKRTRQTIDPQISASPIEAMLRHRAHHRSSAASPSPAAASAAAASARAMMRLHADVREQFCERRQPLIIPNPLRNHHHPIKRHQQLLFISGLFILVLILHQSTSNLILCKPNNSNNENNNRNQQQQQAQLTDKQLLRKAFDSSDSSRANPAGSAISHSSGGGSGSQSSATDGGSSSSQQGFQCPEQFGYYTDSKDCTKYYVCVFGEVLHESCTGGLRFSRELQTCDWPRNVDCPQNQTTSTTSSSSETTTQPTTTTQTSSSSSSSSSSSASASASATTQPTTSTTTRAATTSTTTSASASESSGGGGGGSSSSLVFADENSDPQQPSFDEAISPVITADGAIHLHDGSGGTFALGPNHNRALASSSPQSFNGPVEAGGLSGGGGGQSGGNMDVFVMPLSIAQQQQQQRRNSANKHQRARFQQAPRQSISLDNKQLLANSNQHQQVNGLNDNNHNNAHSRLATSDMSTGNNNVAELSDEPGDFNLAGPTSGSSHNHDNNNGPESEPDDSNGGPSEANDPQEVPSSSSQTLPLGQDNQGSNDNNNESNMQDSPSSVSADTNDQDPNSNSDYIDDITNGQPYIPPVLTSLNQDNNNNNNNNNRFAPRQTQTTSSIQSQLGAGRQQTSPLLSINNRQIVDPTRQTFKPILAPETTASSQAHENGQLISSSRPPPQQQNQRPQQQIQPSQSNINANNRQNNRHQLQQLQNTNAQNNRQSRMSSGFSSGAAITTQLNNQTTSSRLLQPAADKHQQQLISSNVNFNDSSKLIRFSQSSQAPAQAQQQQQHHPNQQQQRPQTTALTATFPRVAPSQPHQLQNQLRPTGTTQTRSQQQNTNLLFSAQKPGFGFGASDTSPAAAADRFLSTTSLARNHSSHRQHFAEQQQQPPSSGLSSLADFHQDFPMSQQQQQQQRRPRPPKRHQIPSGAGGPSSSTPPTSRHQNVLLADLDPTTTTMRTPLMDRQQQQQQNNNNNNNNLLMSSLSGSDEQPLSGAAGDQDEAGNGNNNDEQPAPPTRPQLRPVAPTTVSFRGFALSSPFPQANQAPLSSTTTAATSTTEATSVRQRGFNGAQLRSQGQQQQQQAPLPLPLPIDQLVNSANSLPLNGNGNTNLNQLPPSSTTTTTTTTASLSTTSTSPSTATTSDGGHLLNANNGQLPPAPTSSSTGDDATQPTTAADPQAVANRYLSSAIDALEAGQPFGTVDYDFDILNDNSTERRSPASATSTTPAASGQLQAQQQQQQNLTTTQNQSQNLPNLALTRPNANANPNPRQRQQSASVTAAASLPPTDGQIVNIGSNEQSLNSGSRGKSERAQSSGRSRSSAAASRSNGGAGSQTQSVAPSQQQQQQTTTSSPGQQQQQPPTKKPRPTNKKIVVNHEQALANIRASIEPAKRPEALFATPQPLQQATKCDSRVCRLPDCKCGDTLTPGGIDPKVIPQVVLLTFDDAVNDLNWEIYEELFSGRTNPNGCPVLATFYVSHEWTDYGQVQTLYSRGHEMASHSVTHSFGEKFSKSQWFKEINGQREILNMYGGVKMNDVRGMRAPFLQIGGNKMFEMLYDANFTYDSSMPIFENSPPLWPYTLDYQVTHECMITPCPTKSFPGVWEVGMTMWVDLRGGRCSMGDACSNPTDEDGVYEMLMKNFNRHYKSNRAPFGLFYHSAWFNTVHHRRGFLRFMSAVNALPDVFFVTNWQMLQWMRQPTPVSEINSFEPWQCPAKNDRPPPCYHPSVCNVKSEHGTRFMKTCQPCPANQQYPWVGATGFKQSKQNGSG